MKLVERMKMSPSLRDCELVIERALCAYAAAGDALRTIRDDKLYKAEFSSFEDYCRERWGWSRRRADQQIAAAEVHDAIVAENENRGSHLEPPRTERAARELTTLRSEPDRLAEVWTRVVERHGPEAEAKHVRAAIQAPPASVSPNGDTAPPFADLEVVYDRADGRDEAMERRFDLILKSPGTQLSESKGGAANVFCSPDGKRVVFLGAVDFEKRLGLEFKPDDKPLTERQRQIAEKARERLRTSVGMLSVHGIEHDEFKSISSKNVSKAAAVLGVEEIEEFLEHLDRGDDHRRYLRNALILAKAKNEAGR